MNAPLPPPADDGRTEQRLDALAAAFRRLTPGQQANFVTVARAWADETHIEDAGAGDVALIGQVLNLGLDLMAGKDDGQAVDVDALNTYLITNRHPLDLLKMHALNDWEDLRDRVQRIRAAAAGAGDNDGESGS